MNIVSMANHQSAQLSSLTGSRATYSMLGKEHSSEAALANLLASSELADDLVWLHLWRWWRRPPRGWWQAAGMRHDCGVVLCCRTIYQRPPLLQPLSAVLVDGADRRMHGWRRSGAVDARCRGVGGGAWRVYAGGMGTGE